MNRSMMPKIMVVPAVFGFIIWANIHSSHFSSAKRFPASSINDCWKLFASEKSESIESTLTALDDRAQGQGLLKEWKGSLSESKGLKRRAFGTILHFIPQVGSLAGFPEIALDAKAVVLAFPGAGLETATGETFMQDARTLRRYGISVVSFDYPFHGGGPKENRYRNPEQFKAMVFQIIRYLKSSGKPLYLIGHSAGPSIIQELLFDSPNIANGAIFLSPGGPTSPLFQEHYRMQLASGELDREIGRSGKVNDEGESWMEAMDRGFVSNKIIAMKTTKPILIIAGNKDSWSTPELLEDLRSHYQNAALEIAPGIGHLIFEARGRSESLVNERLLGFISEHEGISLERSPTKKLPDSLQLKYYYETSSWMRRWFVSENIRIESCLQNEKLSEIIMARWYSYSNSVLQSMAKQKLSTVIRGTSESEAIARIISLSPGTLNLGDISFLLRFLGD